jgi:hypothetical protein
MNEVRFEMIVSNENTEAYVESNLAPKSLEAMANDAARIQKVMDETLPGGEWAVKIFRHVSGRAEAVITVEWNGKTTITVPQTEQTQQGHDMLRFRNEAERTIGILILQREGMKGLKKQLAEDSLTVAFADAATAEQAEGILAHFDLADLRNRMLK